MLGTYTGNQRVKLLVFAQISVCGHFHAARRTLLLTSAHAVLDAFSAKAMQALHHSGGVAHDAYSNTQKKKNRQCLLLGRKRNTTRRHTGQTATKRAVPQRYSGAATPSLPRQMGHVSLPTTTCSLTASVTWCGGEQSKRAPPMERATHLLDLARNAAHIVESESCRRKSQTTTKKRPR